MTDCPEHSGHNSEHNRAPMDNLMRSLDNNQSGEGRHKCPYCAYERGKAEGFKSGVEQAMQKLCEILKG